MRRMRNDAFLPDMAVKWSNTTGCYAVPQQEETDKYWFR